MDAPSSPPTPPIPAADSRGCHKRVRFDGDIFIIIQKDCTFGRVVRMVGTLLGGITLIIIPFLSLMADTTTKMKGASQAYGSVEAHNLDEISPDSRKIAEEIIPRINEIGEDSSSTMFIILSPQFLVNNPPVIEALHQA